MSKGHSIKKRNKQKRIEPPVSEDEAAWRAGITVFALQELGKLGMVKLNPREAAIKLGATPERIAAGLQMVEEFLAEADLAGPGRPEGTAAEDGHPNTYAVMCAVRDYLMDNPGAAYQGDERATYSEGFKTFVAELRGLGGPGHEMTRAQFAYATGVSINTLDSWATEPRRRPDNESPAL